MPAGESKQVRWSQSVPEDWLPAIDREADKRGLTRMDFVREAIKQQLPESVAKKLSKPQRAGRPKS